MPSRILSEIWRQGKRMGCEFVERYLRGNLRCSKRWEWVMSVYPDKTYTKLTKRKKQTKKHMKSDRTYFCSHFAISSILFTHFQCILSQDILQVTNYLKFDLLQLHLCTWLFETCFSLPCTIHGCYLNLSWWVDKKCNDSFHQEAIFSSLVEDLSSTVTALLTLWQNLSWGLSLSVLVTH